MPVKIHDESLGLRLLQPILVENVVSLIVVKIQCRVTGSQLKPRRVFRRFLDEQRTQFYPSTSQGTLVPAASCSSVIL